MKNSPVAIAATKQRLLISSSLPKTLVVRVGRFWEQRDDFGRLVSSEKLKYPVAVEDELDL